MLTFNIKQITMTTEVMTKTEAIKAVGHKLVANGLVKEDYIQGMLNRESQITTYLENGIAIPHGTNETKDFVVDTGVAIYFFKNPVDWGEGNKVTLMVGIAARGMEHLDVLRSLTHTLMDEELEEKFKLVNSEQDVLDLLTTGNVIPKVVDTENNDFSFTIKINNPYGLHARPCTELVKLVKSFENEILIANFSSGTELVNAKSMLKVLNLGVRKGQELKFVIRGKDPENIESVLRNAIISGLGE